MNAPMNQHNPDKKLVVRCTFNKNHKKITFQSAQRCTFDNLREKIVQCFSLSASSFDIWYKDDDGETLKIWTDDQLTGAITYFADAADDAHTSSASSIFSGRGFGSRKITLPVQIEVEYEGPSLSDTGSIASIEEYGSRNGDVGEWSSAFSARDLDDDSATVSSRDNGRLSTRSFVRNRVSSPLHGRASQLSGESSWDAFSGSTGPARSISRQDQDPFADSNGQSPNGILERLRLENDAASTDYDPLASDQRGTHWLKEQNERAKRSLGVLPASSASDESSFSLLEQEDQVGPLSLQRAPTGRYYYEYDSEASQSQMTGPEDRGFEIDPSIDGGINGKPRPTSRQWAWVTAQQDATALRPPPHTHRSDPSLETIVPAEILQNLDPPRGENLTCCSGCGRFLNYVKYVCYTCRDKETGSDISSPTSSNKGKGRDCPPFTYPPTPLQTNIYTSPLSLNFSSSSNTFVGSPSKRRPLPPQPSVSTSFATLVPPTSPRMATGYELCYECIEEVGHMHAIEAMNEPGSSPTTSNLSSSFPKDAAVQWRRAPPKQKGQLRHAYVEKIWGHNGWDDIVHTEKETEICSACSAKSSPQQMMYKCVSCERYQLCRACYSQVHDLHPVHTFLVLRGRPPSDSDVTYPKSSNDFEEPSNVHRGVECVNCRLEIVGARFHCVECASVDICSNCDSNGLPGNIDSADGGHHSSHLLIKITIPLSNSGVQSVSRKARNLWTKNPANVNRVEQATSEISSYARTVIGMGNKPESHDIPCDACQKPIIGVRYQCANCPAPQSGYNLCSSCEDASYTVHNPMHAFFKLPRPVDLPIKSSVPIIPQLYKVPAGPSSAVYDIGNPTGYLLSIIHPKVRCDCCYTEIQGAWFHCANCGKDLCSTCEKIDTHNDSHVFLVFKALVDMQILGNLIVNTEKPVPVLKNLVYTATD
ncbi:hypothetical protein F5051DRAFT_421058 [Lentinula edodes]|nr:hypothetical protein F5051DRAFT_421058 [Lentinula edodes]